MTSRQQILLIGINYEPEQTGIGPYTTGMAEHLAGCGYRITVVTGMPHYPQWKVEPAFRWRFRTRERRSSVDLRRMRHYTPSAQSALGRAMYEATFLVQAISVRNLHTPDCVLGVVPSLSGGLAALILARRYRVPLGLIFQDLIGRATVQSGIPRGALAAGPARAIEAYAARRARKIAVVAEAFRPHMVAMGVAPADIVHLPNWSHVRRPGRAPAEVREALGWSSEHPVVLHAGNMGYKQNLDNVLQTARLAADRGSELRFVLMGDGSERRQLEALATGIGNVRFLDPQPENAFMDILGSADVLLVNERSTVIDMSLPSKITSYFRAGRPVVAAVPVGGATSKELRRSGGAFIVPSSDPAALLEAITNVVDNPELAATLIDRADTYADLYLDKRKLLDGAEEFVRSLTADPNQAK